MKGVLLKSRFAAILSLAAIALFSAEADAQRYTGVEVHYRTTDPQGLGFCSGSDLNALV